MDQAVKDLPGRAGRSRGTIEDGGKRLMGLLADRSENVFLRREIEIDAGLRQSGLLRDRARRDPGEALAHEQRFGRGENLLPALPARSLRFPLRSDRSQ